MNLSRLTRPAILCQCSRCSSSLAALENEWAKLSNSYSIAAGWLSIELHRISISSEKKQIPQSSELSLIRGRIIQEISCKLCQLKLGVLCALDSGPNIFWKLSKVSFREIVTMRTVEPTFNDIDGVLESLIFPNYKSHGALVLTGSNEVDHSVSVEQQIQHQGLSLDHISSSVSNLHDTMHELKQSFTAMRIELNGPSRTPNDFGYLTHGDFNVVTTVLKELKLKSDEIEKLKLEIEALKLRNRYVEEQTVKPTLLPPEPMEAILPEVGTPGLLQGSRKRPYPEAFPGGHNKPVADSFDDEDSEEDSMVNFSLGESSTPFIKIPLKDSEASAEPVHGPPSSEPPRLQIEVGHSTPYSASLDEPIAKRPRLSSYASQNSGTKKPGRGRPRGSISRITKPDMTPNSIPPNEQKVNIGNNSHRDLPPSTSTPNDLRNPSSIEDRPARSRTLRSRSRPPSPNSRTRISLDIHEKSRDETQLDQDAVLNSTSQRVVDLGKENSQETNGFHTGAGTGKKIDTNNEKRKAQTAARDIMAKIAMQREEAMDTAGSR